MSLQRLLDPLRRRVLNTIARGLIRAADDSGALQKLQVALLADELLDKVDRVQEYGFSSVPKAGAEVIAVFLGGNRDHGIVIATDDRKTRPKAQDPGDVALYTGSGAKLTLKDATQAVELTLQKFKVSNGSNELIAVLSELVQALIDARVATAAGPQPLLNVADPFPTIKAKLDSFKE